MEQVKNFVLEAGFEIPKQARPFTKQEIIDVINMLTSELVELAETVMSTEEAIKTVQHGALVDLSKLDISKDRIRGLKDVQDDILTLWLHNAEIHQSIVETVECLYDSFGPTCDSETSEETPNFTDAELIEEQADAFVDIYYYSLDRTLRHGINMDRFFDIVHEANMSKRGPDGKFIIREDGEHNKKVQKPDGWISPLLITGKKETLDQMCDNGL